MENMYSPISKKLVEFPTLNEAEFYEAFITLDNLTKPKEERLPEKAIQLLSAYLAKPLNYNLYFGKRRIKDKETDTTLAVQLGKEVGLTATYTYYLMNELRNKKALVVTEDKLIAPNTGLDTLRRGTKRMLDQYPVMKFEYVFAAKVVEDEEYNESNLPTSSEGNRIQPPTD